MSQIQTHTARNGNIFIRVASGERITPSKLKVGETYLYKDPYKTKTIQDIRGDDVYYQENSGYGVCKKAHFARQCPNVATEAEIRFLNK